MTKAIAVLNFYKTKRLLKLLCDYYNVSYKYCHSLTTDETKSPSYSIIENFSMNDFIPPEFWFEKADLNFFNSLERKYQETH